MKVDELRAAYAGKTVLVTGHAGFKGAWLTLLLQELGARVVGYSDGPPSSPSMHGALELERFCADLRGDVRDGAALRATVDEYGPDAIFHLAAQPLVRLSYDDPVGTFESNVMGTVNVLDAVRTADRPMAVVVITSDKCYENREWLWGYRECEPMGGHDPYSASKGCAELVVSAYRRSFFAAGDGTLLASARAGNIIGGGDWALDRLVPDCARALAQGRRIVIRSPRAVRPWQHVLDPLHGYLALGAHLLRGEAQFAEGWNFGPADADVWAVEDVVRAACSAWGEGGYDVAADADRHEAHLLRLDCTKANARLGWRGLLSVGEAVAWTVRWYKEFYAGATRDALLKLSICQIRDYLDKAVSRESEENK